MLMEISLRTVCIACYPLDIYIHIYIFEYLYILSIFECISSIFVRLSYIFIGYSNKEATEKKKMLAP